MVWYLTRETSYGEGEGRKSLGEGVCFFREGAAKSILDAVGKY